MSPAEVMAIEIEKVLFPVQTQDYLEQSARFDECKKAARAALRALAEMESQENIRDYLLAKAETEAGKEIKRLNSRLKFIEGMARVSRTPEDVSASGKEGKNVTG